MGLLGLYPRMGERGPLKELQGLGCRVGVSGVKVRAFGVFHFSELWRG